MQGIPIEDLIADGRIGGPLHRWPTRIPGNRLEPEAWPQLQPRFTIKSGATLFTIGSCFARHIEEHLQRLGFDVPMLGFAIPASEYTGNRVSVLNRFTPTAMHQEIEWASRIFLAGGEPTPAQLSECLIDLPDGRCVDAHLGGLFTVSRASAIGLRRELARAVVRAFDADVVVITLGLVETWWDATDSRFIQKIPNPEMVAAYPGRFFFRRLGFEECTQRMRGMLELLRRLGKPDKRFLVTTSPVPMWQTFAREDILVANTYSKSLLRTVAGCLAQEHDDVDYFPSYESVMLSSDRTEVWHDDQLHVTDGFIGKVVQRLIGSYLVGSVAAGLAAAEHELDAQRPAEALALLERLDPARSNDDFERQQFHRCCVRALKKLGRNDGVARHLEAMMAMGIRDPLLAREVADAWATLGSPGRALAVLAPVDAGEDDPADLHWIRARYLEQLDRFEEALNECRLSLALRMPRAGVHAKMAQLALGLNQPEEAERSFRAAIELAPGNPKFALGLARLLLGRGRVLEAEQIVESVPSPGESDAGFEQLRQRIRTSAR